MVAVLRIDSELIDHLKVILTPILQVDQRIIQRRAVVACEGVEIAKDLGGGEDVRLDDLVEQPGKLAVRQLDAVEGFKLFSKITLKRRTAIDICTINVFQFSQTGYQVGFDFLFSHEL